MSTIAIAKSALKSRVVRELIGERTIDIFQSITANEEQDEDGLFSWLRGVASKLVGFVTNVVKSAVTWLLRNIWDIIVEASFELAYFDWNQTDAAIRQEIEANNALIGGALGDLAGTSLVWIASIGIAGAASLKFPVLGGQIALALAEEGGEEIRGQIVNLIQTTRNSVTRNLVLGGLLTARKMKLFGLESISDEREPWSIAGAIEERVESIDNEFLRQFVENFLDSAVESIIEVGYVVSYVLDDYYSAAKLANESQFGESRLVELTPDTQAPDEKVVLSGPQTLIQQNVQTAITTHRLVHNRDVGQIVGQPAEDWLRKGLQRRKMTIVFKNKAKPPWVQKGSTHKEVSYTIPSPKPGLKWEEIKLAARKFNWGKFRATANLNNGQQMAVHGATAAEAEDKLRELLQLSTAKLVTLSVSEEKDRNPTLRKRATIMYPAYATLLVRRPTATLTGTTDLSGNRYRQELQRIELWPSTEPPGYKPTK